MTHPKILSSKLFANNRFCLVTFQTRFGTIEYHITDAETVSDDEVRAGKLPEIVCQAGSRDEALAYIKAHS